VTVGIDLGYIKTILSHAAAVHGVVVSTEPIDLARIALGRLGLVGKGDERDRRPTQDELDRIVSALEANIRQQIPVGRIIRFAVATAMRQDEIARVEWRDFDASGRMLLIRNRKDPRKKKGNDQRIPLLDVSGYDACKIIEEQGRFSNIREGRIFPYNGRSVGAAFRRQCRDLKIVDLHFHDLRHEGTSRLFEAGFSIEQVALVTGHKDWKMLRRYTHLKLKPYICSEKRTSLETDVNDTRPTAQQARVNRVAVPRNAEAPTTNSTRQRFATALLSTTISNEFGIAPLIPSPS
jgi:integrase